MKTETPTLSIRILRQGLVKAKKPKSFDEWNDLEKRQWADNILETLDDDDILEALADFGNPKEEGYFDCAPDAVAIETEEGDTLMSMPVWEIFKDPEYAENMLIQNKQESAESVSVKERLKMTEKEYEDALKAVREECGTKIAKEIQADESAPKAIKELMEECSINYVGFERASYSPDYMPDHCVYVYLSGDILIGLQTDDKSDTWEECGYEFGDHDISEAMYFSDIVNSNKLTQRYIPQEEGDAAYKYLVDVAKKIEEEDRDFFRDYLLEREV